MKRHFSGPQLLLDTLQCQSNIRAMAEKTARMGLRLRPHFKTHQSRTVGRWYREAGIQAITTSSLQMARYFAQDGWMDILIAFPLNINQLEALEDLAGKVRLGLTVEDEEHLQALAAQFGSHASLYIKVDCGSGRTGIRATEADQLIRLAKQASRIPNLELRGILAHAGHTYRAEGVQQINQIHSESLSELSLALEAVRSVEPQAILTYGDTPSCSVSEDFGPAAELRPGNFVFYDLMQARIGSCSRDQIAIALAAPVVAKHADRKEVILHGGATHLAKDSLPMPDGQPLMGMACRLSEDGWQPAEELGYLRKLSQEHGILRLREEVFPEIRIGDVLAVLPVHACHTAHAMGGYRTLEGNPVDMMPRAGQYA
jgi:D-serine deaminase-like pyridoxal phosphate-dependent protein